MSQRIAARRYDAPVGEIRGGGGLFGRVVEALGQEIVDGTRPGGELIVVDDVIRDFGASRSVVREALRALNSIGLVESRPQVGTWVLPQSSWDLLNPSIVTWRGRGPDSVAQQRELLELRLGVEVTAARLAAERMDAEHRELLVGHARAMLDSVERGDSRGYFEADAAFHRTIVANAGNAVIARFAGVIATVLQARSTDPRLGMNAAARQSVQRHLELAEAIRDGDGTAAEAAVREIVTSTIRELDDVGSPR